MILVLDLGSSSTRAMLYDERANAVPGALARVPFEFVTGEDGRSEDNAREAFQRVVAALDALHALHAHSTNYRSPITALGISSYASSLVCLDDKGNPITPVFTYADTRCAEDARRLRERHDEMAALQRTGCRIRANYLPAKMAWIKRTMPDIFKRTRWFASISDTICLWLFGQMSAGISVASWTGLLNRESSDWDEAWLNALGITREQLPEIAKPSSPRGEAERLFGSGVRGLALLPEWANRWPKFAHAQLHPPVGDGAAANIGSGCVNDSRIAITIGSTAAMRVVASIGNRQSAIGNPALWSYRVDYAHDLIGGATTEGGNVIAWALKTLRLQEDAEQAISALKPDAHGMTVLPTFAGERSPGYAEDIRATLHGLSLDSSPVEIVRALMEGIAYRLATICDALRESGVARADATLAGSGGALLASPAWCQIIADATGVPLHVADVPEATSRGVALLVIGNWLLEDAQHQLPITNYISFNPDSQRHTIYRAAMARQQELYATLVRSDG